MHRSPCLCKFGTRLLALLLLNSSASIAAPPSRDPPMFPADAIWNQDISGILPDLNSGAMITASIGWGTGNTSFQIDFSMHRVYSTWGSVTDEPLVQQSGYFGDCDSGYSVPVPAIGAIEGSTDYTCDLSNDCHLFVQRGEALYESYNTTIDSSGMQSLCLVKWHLALTYPANGHGDGCTSADAAGFPMAPLIFSPDEVYAALPSGDLGHAIRFILPNDRMRAGYYVHPGSHNGSPSSPNPNAIPYGARLRLHGGFNISGYNAAAQVILRTLQKYGMFLSDGGNVPLTADDGMFTVHQWSDADINIDSHSLFGVSLTDFDVMPLGTLIAYDNSSPDANCVRNGFADDVIYIESFDHAW